MGAALCSIALLVTACARSTPEKLLRAAKRGTDTTQFWAGGKETTSLTGVMGYHKLAPLDEAQLEARRLRHEADNLMKATAQLKLVRDRTGQSNAVRDEVMAELHAKAGEMEQQAQELSGKMVRKPVFRALVRYKTPSGASTATTFIIPVDGQGLVTALIDQSVLDGRDDDAVSDIVKRAKLDIEQRFKERKEQAAAAQLALQAERDREREIEEASKEKERRERVEDERRREEEDAARRAAQKVEGERKASDERQRAVEKLEAASASGRHYSGSWTLLGQTGKVGLTFVDRSQGVLTARLEAAGLSRTLRGEIKSQGARHVIHLEAIPGEGVPRTMRSTNPDPSLRWMYKDTSTLVFDLVLHGSSLACSSEAAEWRFDAP